MIQESPLPIDQSKRLLPLVPNVPRVLTTSTLAKTKTPKVGTPKLPDFDLREKQY